MTRHLLKGFKDITECANHAVMSSPVYFPSLGSQLSLNADWAFSLHSERRNRKLFAALGRSWTPWDQWFDFFVLDVVTSAYGRTQQGWADVIVPSGTLLEVDRIYLRNGGSAFDSITFRVLDSPDVRLKADIRFWAKLADCNAMDAAWLPKRMKRGKSQPLNRILHMLPAHQREDGPAYNQTPPDYWKPNPKK